MQQNSKSVCNLKKNLQITSVSMKKIKERKKWNEICL